MSLFEKSNWIWFDTKDSNDEYGEFFTEFEACDETTCRISCDGDYTLFINGAYAASNQYGDFEHYKIYDEISITPHVKSGKNTLSLIVWHHGLGTSRYKSARAGVIFEILNKDKIVASSNENVKARKSPTYESGRCKLITLQLGYGFHYDANFEDGSLFNGHNFGKSYVVDKNCTFYPRIEKKLCLAKSEKPAKILSEHCGKYFLIDLESETVGLLKLKFNSKTKQKIRIDWGEDLQEGHVRRVIGSRVFSVDYTAKPGLNDYINYLLRFGCRFIEIWAEEEIELYYAGIIPQFYPVKEKNAKLADGLDQKIYNLCLNTLKLSMMEHYVDCPWREQALYVYDSRNQMLSGYYAFEGGNSLYAYSNLKLISMDRTKSGLLSITYPCGKDLAIPSFSLHFFTSIWEYYLHTGDKTFLKEVYPKLLSVIKPFHDNIRNGLVYTFEGKENWNFYDWSDYLDGNIDSPDREKQVAAPDAIINFLYVIALENLKKISEAAEGVFPYGNEAELIKKKAKETFFDKDTSLFSLRKGKGEYTELANALAIICGAVTGEEAKTICDKILGGETTESSLSLKCFLYDALLLTDEKYKQNVLDEIRRNYKHMLDMGATSAWETIKGAADFGNAGSLCHGWSAIPVYYYHKFSMVSYT